MPSHILDDPDHRTFLRTKADLLRSTLGWLGDSRAELVLLLTTLRRPFSYRDSSARSSGAAARALRRSLSRGGCRSRVCFPHEGRLFPRVKDLISVGGPPLATQRCPAYRAEGAPSGNLSHYMHLHSFRLLSSSGGGASPTYRTSLEIPMLEEGA